MRAVVIAIGDELLTGRTLDYNSHWIAKRLTSLGIEVSRIVVVPDREIDIMGEIKRCMNTNTDIIITTGGLGPTPGDITLDALAKALRIDLELNENALKMVKERYEQLFMMGYIRSKEITPDREKMARIPRGAIPFYNPIGVAPGILLPFRKESGETIYILSLPGVPSEMMYLLEQMMQFISMRLKGELIRTREITLEIRDESFVAGILSEINKKYPGVYVKTYPVGFGEKVLMRVIVMARGRDPGKLDRLITEAIEYLKKRIYEVKDNL